MLEYSRKICLEKVSWKTDDQHVPAQSKIIILECWQYSGMAVAEENKNYRSISMTFDDTTHAADSDHSDDELELWLQSRGPYQPPEPPSTGTRVNGSMRIVFCDRLNVASGINISKGNFLAIEKAFHLHAATLPAFLSLAGTYGTFYETSLVNNEIQSISLVAKVPQRSDTANYTISIHYDVSTGSTNALICGAGVVFSRSTQDQLVNQYEQLKNLILATPKWWNNPLCLPSLLVHDYGIRLRARSGSMINQALELEEKIGVTNAGIIRNSFNLNGWSRHDDPKSTSIKLHSLSVRFQNLDLALGWYLDYTSFLLKMSQEIIESKSCKDHKIELQRVAQSIRFLRTDGQNRQRRVAAFGHRSNLQLNILSNIISQEDSVVNRQDALLNFRIAKSSKQDSISVTTFTFITALFLPGTYVATIFSMTMFDWHLENNVGGNDITTSAQPAATMMPYVSNKFWIFWVVTVPLTFITMAFWYFWSRYSNSRWLEELHVAPTQEYHVPLLPKPIISRPDTDLERFRSPLIYRASWG